MGLYRLLKCSIFLMFGAFGSPAFSQELPNGGFEIWDFYNSWTLEPMGWTTGNGQLVTPVTQDSMSFEGELAMQVKVLPGFEGGVMSVATALVPSTTVPELLHFAVKCNVPDEDPNDVVFVKVELLVEDNVMASATYESYSSVLDWEEVNLPLPPLEIELTYLRITVVAGYNGPLGGGSWDTSITVDDMYFGSFIGVAGHKDDDGFMLYPNPCLNELRIDIDDISRLGMVYVSDLNGRIWWPTLLNNTLNTASLPSGKYILNAIGKDGQVLSGKFIRL